MTRSSPDPAITEQIEYYRRRAPEYDKWFHRVERYDRGAEENERWFRDIDQVRAALADFGPSGSVLELACGTGLWTELLIRSASRLTAVDASPEMLAINQGRVNSDSVRYVRADLFSWEPDRSYDVVFFGFWLSHIPPERFDSFWTVVERALAKSGRVFFVDSLRDPNSTARDHVLPAPSSTTARRRLDNGDEFDVVKVFYDPQILASRLETLGWAIEVESTSRFFLFGHGGRSGTQRSAL